MMPICKSIAVGGVAGAMTYLICSTSCSKKRKIKRSAGKAIKAVGSVVDGLCYMIK